MNEFNPNCGKCGMLNSRGFCSLTACRYPSNVIVAEPKVIRGMMVNPQIEKPLSNGDEIRSMSDEELAKMMEDNGDCPPRACPHEEKGAKITRQDCEMCWLEWLKEEVKDGT